MGHRPPESATLAGATSAVCVAGAAGIYPAVLCRVSTYYPFQSLGGMGRGQHHCITGSSAGSTAGSRGLFSWELDWVPTWL